MSLLQIGFVVEAVNLLGNVGEDALDRKSVV